MPPRFRPQWAIKPLGELLRPLLRPFSDPRTPISSPVRLFYYNPRRTKNVGDQLNVSLIRALTGRRVVAAPAHTADYLCIGSLLDMILRKPGSRAAYRRPLEVWGAGFIAAPGEHPYVKAVAPESFGRPVVFHAVRGRHTLERIKAMGFSGDGVALGDPGLLAGLLADGNATPKRFALGLVPHYVDTTEPVWRNVQAKLGNVRILRVSDPPERFVAEMRECETIISSAMHGLVIADALGIPNRLARISDRLIGGDYKFADYYSVFGVHPEPLSVHDLQSLTNADISRIRSSYAISADAVTAIADGLRARCPFLVTSSDHFA
jgi:pyruvyltransferase